MEVLNLQQVQKFYNGQQVVCGIDLSVQQGECFGLLGPNGAGKTTTLRMCLGLTQADSGSIHLLQQPIPLAGAKARLKVGVVPQFDNLDPDFTITENLIVYGRYFGLSAKQTREKIAYLLDFVGLRHKADNKVAELSGGMKRRVTLARALVNDPDIVFLDEPTTGLDPQAKHLIWERLRQLQAQGKTLILTTHFMDEAERLCSRLAIIDHGKVVVQDSPTGLIAEHIEPQVIEVFGDGAAAWARQEADRVCQRYEVVGETVFCYAQQADALLSALQISGLRYLHRQANLEDVFLKLTGRDLRD